MLLTNHPAVVEMNSKKLNKANAESIASSAGLKVPFIRRARHHSETNDLPFNAYGNLITTGYDLDAQNDPESRLIESRLNAEINKLGGSAPNDSWFFNGGDHHSDSPSHQATDKSPIIYSDYSDLSDDEKSSVKSFKKSSSSFLKFNRSRKTSQSVCKSNYLQPPKKPSSLSSSSTGNIDEQCEQANGRRSQKRSNKSSVKKRKRCYSMDERRRNLRNNNDLNSPFSFDNLAYNKENLSDISEPLSSSEKSNDDLNGKRALKLQQADGDDDDDQPKRALQPPIIMVNNSRLEYGDGGVRFDLNGEEEEEDKNEEDEDYLIKSEFRSSQLDMELGLKESDEDLSDRDTSTALEFTTKLASDLSKAEIEAESLLSFVFQVLFPLLVCGLGNLVAGILLHKIESYEVFKEIPQLYIAVPCLMGLKGNLEMTMASRLSTAANLGILEHLPQILSMTKANIALIQCQATVVSLLASLFGIFTMARENEALNIAHVLILVSSNVICANISCSVLSVLMICIILFCKQKSINPDNVACPLAASLGDVSTVFLLGYFSSYLFECLEASNYWLSPLALAVILIITPFSTIVAFRNKHTKKILKFGWAPIVFSMVISSVAGVILDKVVKLFKGFALYQPIINGVGGNLAAIQASRISTYLHKTSKFGQLPVKELSTIDSKILEANGRMAECKNSESNFSETSYIQLDERNGNDLKDVDLSDEKDGSRLDASYSCGGHLNGDANASAVSNLNFSTQSLGDPNGEHCFNQSAVKTRRMLRIRRKKIKNYLKVIFSSGSIHLKCARLLLLITLPMHVLYFYLIQLLVVEDEQIFGGFFVFFYLLAAFAQMVTLLWLAKQLVYRLWIKKIDPDDNSIPILSALGDLLGTLLLAIIFFSFGQPAATK